MDENLELFLDVLTGMDHRPFAYSGRIMYGKTCLAVSIEKLEDLPTFGWRVAADLLATTECDLSESPIGLWLENTRLDQLGKGWILYFPQVEIDAATLEDWVGQDDDE